MAKFPQVVSLIHSFSSVEVFENATVDFMRGLSFIFWNFSLAAIVLSSFTVHMSVI